MNLTIDDFNSVFFIGIAGAGMSALAQYLKAAGKNVSGSDRFFGSGQAGGIREKLQTQGIHCYPQDGHGIHENIQLVVATSAIEETVPEMQKARSLGIPVLLRSEMLSLISKSRKTIAVGGTSGKSTTCAMIFEILETAGFAPGILSGAGLTRLIKEGKIGNAKMGSGEWLVIEADESDGSIVEYQPEIGLLLNIDKDHKEIGSLIELFTTFRQNSRHFITNQSHALAAKLSLDTENDFSIFGENAGLSATNFSQEGLKIRFEVKGVLFEMNTVGTHNMENAMAAIAVCHHIGVDLEICADALKGYEGIYRRHQVLGQKNGVWVIDDYAHNPVKCARSIEACQPLASKVIAWFQPHGFGPTRFLKDEFVKEISAVLRPEDEIWMSEIFYAGGTTSKDISAGDLIHEIAQQGKNAFFVANREELLKELRPHFTNDCVLLLMGARDPSLELFSRQIWEEL